VSDGKEPFESADATPTDGAGAGLLDISNAIVGLHKEYYGRGPTKARAIQAKDVVVVILEGGFSQVEQTLTEAGRTDMVQGARHAMQGVIKDRWIETVEAVLGRRVRSFLSATDSDGQIQVETFLLEPEESNDSTADGDGAIAAVS
jgi:uncharacterized protein YbcI